MSNRTAQFWYGSQRKSVAVDEATTAADLVLLAPSLFSGAPVYGNITTKGGALVLNSANIYRLAAANEFVFVPERK